VYRTFLKGDPDVAMDPDPAPPNTDHETRIGTGLRKEVIGDETPEKAIVAEGSPAPVDRPCKPEDALGLTLLEFTLFLMPEPPY
jgi:hypothetical protein